jgi:hypothetical protein
MSILGAHMSIAGGVSKAVERAHKAGCDCVQIFTANNHQWPKLTPPPADRKAVPTGGPLTKNNNQWRVKVITIEEARSVRRYMRIAKSVTSSTLPARLDEPASSANEFSDNFPLPVPAHVVCLLL